MSFIRRQEEKLAIRYLNWQYEKNGIPKPDDDLLVEKARWIVEQAHRIAKERGKNIAGIIQDLAADLMKK